ncbi:GntR family transcriptional regulator [Dysosmobacter welbionis]
MLFDLENYEKPKTQIDTVYNRLKQDIIYGVIPEGSFFSNEEISKKYQVGRSPVREAIRKLETDGLVLIRPQVGVLVAPLTVKEFQEITEMRVVLEKLAVEHLVRNRDKADFSPIDRLTLWEQNETDPQKLAMIRLQIHLEIYNLSGQTILYKVLSQLYDKFSRYVLFYANSVGQNTVHAQSEHKHDELVERIKHGTKQVICDLLNKHIYEFYDEIIALLESRKD